MAAYLDIPTCPVLLVFEDQDVEKVRHRIAEVARYPERVSRLDYDGGAVVLRIANVPVIHVSAQPTATDDRPVVGVEIDQI